MKPHTLTRTWACHDESRNELHAPKKNNQINKKGRIKGVPTICLVDTHTESDLQHIRLSIHKSSFHTKELPWQR